MSFDTLLVANRGEIARRVMRSAREMGIRSAAVYVDADRDAPFVRDADIAVRLETSYLDGKAILAAAARTGAGAVHPGAAEITGDSVDGDCDGIEWCYADFDGDGLVDNTDLNLLLEWMYGYDPIAPAPLDCP